MRPISNCQFSWSILEKYFAILTNSELAPDRISHTEKPNTIGVDAFLVARNSDRVTLTFSYKFQVTAARIVL